MSVLKKYFNREINQSSPVQVDYNRVVCHDEDGQEFVTYEEVDYPSLQRANGIASDWSLDSLLKAGINPNFPIHTGNNTRLDGIDVVKEAEAIADAIFAEENKDNN